MNRGEGMTAGRDCIGVGVGAVVRDDTGRVFLAQRGPEARNERGLWEFPGGEVSYGETLEDAIRREIAEEYGMTIEVTDQLGAFDHILAAESQHWVSVTFLARVAGGEPVIREPGKCSQIGWFGLDALPEPLSDITVTNLNRLRELGWSAAAFTPGGGGVAAGRSPDRGTDDGLVGGQPGAVIAGTEDAEQERADQAGHEDGDHQQPRHRFG
jgi:8-oxo-dGTP diphosphatase